MSAMFETAADAKKFIMSGKAIFTVVSKKSGKRFTYQVEMSKTDKLAKKQDGIRFAKLMTGSDNEQSYQYIGIIKDGKFSHGRRSKISPTAGGVVALDWVLRWLKEDNIQSDQLEIWHEGRCGACGRRLTVPASIASGIGPECSKRVFECA